MKVAVSAALLSLSLCACASSGWPTRADASEISGAPDHFLVVDAATGASNEPAGTASCRSPIVDPRDGSRLALVRSNDGYGDYQPDGQRYGLEPGKLLRITCHDGRPVGAASAP